MDSHVKEYFRQFSDETPHGNFHQVIPLHETKKYDWKEIHNMVPSMCKGWFELSRLPSPDRLEFIRDFWFAQLPFTLSMPKVLNSFFHSIDEIGVFITQQRFDDPFEAQLVYSLKGNSGYFHGMSGATDEEIRSLQKLFPDYTLPADYVAFMKIHSGFSKGIDTGIIPTTKMWPAYQQFQNMLSLEEDVTTQSGEIVDPKTLIPFYESFGMPFYQCFWANWYPEEEMGNVYYSGLTKKIPDVKGAIYGEETLAFPTFISWLLFYLELIDKES